MKRIALLGSTGSIGHSTLKVIRRHGHRFQLVALAARRNLALLVDQIEEFRPRIVAVYDEALASELRTRCPLARGLEIVTGPEGYAHVAALPEVDTVVSAMSGGAGLLPTYSAVAAGKDVALANKEAMVTAGGLITERARTSGSRLLPIDSEHNAIFQCLQGHPRADIRRVILTASGGPFREMSLEDMASVQPRQALNHPNWQMGPKVTVDSATLMNKGLEAIEAQWFFGLLIEQVDILVHPQSIVHSLVEYRDGAVLAQLGMPDMVVPIAYALAFPDHLENEVPRLRLEQVGHLAFEKPDLQRFRCLALALEAARGGLSLPAVLNAANEVAVTGFLDGRLGFLDIPRVIEATLERHRPFPIQGVEDALAAEDWARTTATDLVARFTRHAFPSGKLHG